MSRREQLKHYLGDLRKNIMQAFAALEPEKAFEYTPWQHHTGGGGEIGLLRGDVFEKAAVNISAVEGPHYPFNKDEGAFFATGVSLITHMANPHAPTVHFNLRYIETANRWWFGGGYDLTPMGIPYEEDTLHFHEVAANALQPFGSELYTTFSENAKEYFYIPHWKKERGVGGLFFDHYNSGNFESDCALWQMLGNTFLDAILPIYQRRLDLPFTEQERQHQLEMRGHYVEFNLIYDRGTKFGLQSGGNPAAFLCSLPPLAKW
jgi:coproporphyrinogen III oxidase